MEADGDSGVAVDSGVAADSGEATAEGADWVAEVGAGAGVDSAAVATHQGFRIQGSVCGLEFSVQGFEFRD
jgi:hypothetical protein